MAIEHHLFMYRHLDRSALREDSPRFRHRLAGLFQLLQRKDIDYVGFLKRDAGLVVPYNGFHDWDRFWTQGPIEEVVTAITLVYLATWGTGYKRIADEFRDAVARAIAEEHLAFRLDEDGSVHLRVDEDFEVARLATLKGLDDARLKDARDAYEAAHTYLDGEPPNTLQAVRRAFESVEIVARQLAPTHKNLHVRLCKEDLKAICVPALTTDTVESKVLASVFDSMGEWVAGVHFYRHGQPESAAPSFDTAVLILTDASAYLRLLAKVALQVLPQP